MERLTGPKWSNRHYHIYATVYPKRKDMEPAFQKIVDRLGRYEDTGLEPEEIPHWISVSERLPEELGHYLAVVKRIAPDELGGNETRIRIMRWLGEDWQYARHMPEWINQKITETVTHWMPLPAVPKEEK